jgi:hypothetical protein
MERGAESLIGSASCRCGASDRERGPEPVGEVRLRDLFKEACEATKLERCGRPGRGTAYGDRSGDVRVGPAVLQGVLARDVRRWTLARDGRRGIRERRSPGRPERKVSRAAFLRFVGGCESTKGELGTLNAGPPPEVTGWKVKPRQGAFGRPGHRRQPRRNPEEG